MQDIEMRSDGLTYYKNTNELVDGKAVRKFEDGIIAETANYEKGKQVGKWNSYDHQGDDFTHGYIIAIAEEIISSNKNLQLANATLSINFEGDYKYASFGIPGNSPEPGNADLLNIRNIIFKKYKDNHQFKDVFIFYKDKQYRFEKVNYFVPISYDTVKINDGIIINVR
jgi:hypothetical protein